MPPYSSRSTTYSHYLPGMQEKTVDAMQSALKTPFRDGQEA